MFNTKITNRYVMTSNGHCIYDDTTYRADNRWFRGTMINVNSIPLCLVHQKGKCICFNRYVNITDNSTVCVYHLQVVRNPICDALDNNNLEELKYYVEEKGFPVNAECLLYRRKVVRPYDLCYMYGKMVYDYMYLTDKIYLLSYAINVKVDIDIIKYIIEKGYHRRLKKIVKIDSLYKSERLYKRISRTFHEDLNVILYLINNVTVVDNYDINKIHDDTIRNFIIYQSTLSLFESIGNISKYNFNMDLCRKIMEFVSEIAV